MTYIKVELTGETQVAKNCYKTTVNSKFDVRFGHLYETVSYFSVMLVFKGISINRQ